MIDHDTWVTLSRRLDQIQLERRRLEDEADDSVKLVFDSDDQARVVPR